MVGYVAVFIAPSGTAYAVDGPLPGQNQVGSEDIINGEVQTLDIDDANGVRSADVQGDTLQNGGLAGVLRFVKNAASTVARDDRLPGTDRFDQPLVNLSTVTSLAAGDFVEAEAFQDSGGNLAGLKIPDFSPAVSTTWLARGRNRGQRRSARSTGLSPFS